MLGSVDPAGVNTSSAGGYSSQMAMSSLSLTGINGFQTRGRGGMAQFTEDETVRDRAIFFGGLFFFERIPIYWFFGMLIVF